MDSAMKELDEMFCNLVKVYYDLISKNETDKYVRDKIYSYSLKNIMKICRKHDIDTSVLENTDLNQMVDEFIENLQR